MERPETVEGYKNRWDFLEAGGHKK